MDFETATRTAEEQVSRLGADSDIRMELFRDKTFVRDFGWVFFYGPEDKSTPVAGNAPFIVDRQSGLIHFTGTAYPLEDYLDSYARVGRTYLFAAPEHLVVLEDWTPGFLKISLTRVIREATSMELKEANDCTEAVLAGKAVTLVLPSAGDADKFCSVVGPMGVRTRRLTRYH